MATAADVAAWLQAEIERAGELALADAVATIRARFGAEFAPGGRIRPDVLRELRRLTPGRRVWVGSTQAWRRRVLHSPPRHGRGDGGP